jgi:hypothetical protein
MYGDFLLAMAFAYEHILDAISLRRLCSEASVACWNAATQRAIASTHADMLLLATQFSRGGSLVINVSKDTDIRLRSWIS